MKKIFLLFTLAVFFTSCTSSSSNPTKIPEKTQEATSIQVTSSIIPISSIIKNIGGEYVEVNTIVPAGVSPHGFDMSARQMIEVEKSERIFLVWLDEIDGFLKKVAPPEKQVHLADGVKLIRADAHHHEEEEEHSKDKHLEDEGGHGHNRDPHIWLGKDNALLIAEKVRDELSVLLPEHAPYFSQNVDTFRWELEQIYSDFQTKTAGKSPRKFIVFHDAYNYMIQSVGMDLELRIPFSKNVLHETWTAQKKELIEEIELHGVQYIFREPQFSDRNLQKFANEYNLNIGILDPLGTDVSAGGYLQNLRNNLESLWVVYE